MSVQPAPKTMLDSALGLIAKRLRGESGEAARERLPVRWVELIKHLNEQERSRERVQNAERKRRENPH